MSASAWQRALVIGASSGIGEATARALGRRGTRVALVARRLERLQTVCDEINQAAGQDLAFAVEHDVLGTDTVPQVFADIAHRLGGLDLVVYCAGEMPRIGAHEYSTQRDTGTIAVNFTGAVAWLNEAAYRFERARAGTIVGVSSVAGDRGRKGNVVYGASKAALNAYLESLRYRLASAGVKVVTVKPGYVRTQLVAGIALPRLFPVIEPDEAAVGLLTAAEAGKAVAYVPRFWRAVMIIIGAIPAAVMKRLNV